METNGTAAVENAVRETDFLQPTDIEQGIAAPGEASTLSDSWYLQAYVPRPSGENAKYDTRRGRLVLNGTWRKFAVALSLGLCAGFGVAALKVAHSPAASEQTAAGRSPLPAEAGTRGNGAKLATGRPRSLTAQEPAETTTVKVQTKHIPVRLTKATASLTADEAARLKARNRRLEALIEVLRQRTQEKKPAPEQTTYIGQ